MRQRNTNNDRKYTYIYIKFGKNLNSHSKIKKVFIERAKVD